MTSDDISSVIFVCTANQCRSPMAEGLMRNWLEKKGMADSWEVASAGVDAVPGIPATNTASRAMAERSISIDDHRSRPVSESLLAAFDIILVMEGWHQQLLQEDYPAHAQKVHLIRERAGMKGDVDDPVGGSLEEYRDTANELQGLMESIFVKLM